MNGTARSDTNSSTASAYRRKRCNRLKATDCLTRPAFKEIVVHAYDDRGKAVASLNKPALAGLYKRHHHLLHDHDIAAMRASFGPLQSHAPPHHGWKLKRRWKQPWPCPLPHAVS
ncbi:DUF3885 domain-containing protein [Janthinobacterium sp. PC23-8]|uniref:DUF3885 domain-containing protein n=1 Tax=Janthinobacterium sp. PC23-8 TaxID=2012679 RepID=UPI0034E959CA